MVTDNKVLSADQMRKKMASFQELCRRKGLRLTPQRLAIYQSLLESRDHPSADVLYRRLHNDHPTMSLDTVNRTLLTLSDIGAALVVEGTGEPKRFDANLDAHQHFRCVKCKTIIDFHHEPFDNVPIPKYLTQGFQVLRQTVYFEGICGNCSQ